MTSDRNKNIIMLNVGGTTYCTTKETVKNSQRLVDLIENDCTESFVNENDEIFVDRDGFMFRHILQYLRTGEINIENYEQLKELKAEATFYQLNILEGKVDEMLEKQKKIYQLVDKDELERLTNLNPATNHMVSTSPYFKDFELITTVNYLCHVYKCPRNIFVHDLPNKCGRACKKVPLCGHTGWIYEPATMYLITYDKKV